MTITVSFDPVLARLGAFQLSWHGLLTALALLVAVSFGQQACERAAQKYGFAADSIPAMSYWAVAGGFVGARLFHVVDHLPTYLANPASILAIWEGGIAVYGSFIGGVVAGWIAVRLMHLPAWPLLDAAGPAMLVGQAIGRLGCLANGDAWGRPCNGDPGLCLAYTHPEALVPASLLGVPTHAYPAYEIAATLVLLGLLWLVARRWPDAPPGVLFLLAAIGYAVIRFSLTVFRQETAVLWGLQEAQVIAVVTGLAAAVALVVRWRPWRTRTAPV
jgi:phosphatidylglycerol:prolipoprotein diacylglycerol transferase